jgi:hypothetical protein
LTGSIVHYAGGANMTDLERMIALYDSLAIKYTVKKRADFDNDYDFYGHIARYSGKYPEYNEVLTIGEQWYFAVFEFKDGVFQNNYLTE